MQSHPSLSLEERSRICRCVNYKKLSLEACKELAKNPRIPPLISIQALASQHSSIINNISRQDYLFTTTTPPTPISSRSSKSRKQMVLYKIEDEIKRYGNNENNNIGEGEGEGEKEKDVGLMKMQWKLIELEKACRDMKGRMSIMGKSNGVLIVPSLTRTLPRMC